MATNWIGASKWAMPVVGEPMRCTKYNGEKWVTSNVVAIYPWDRETVEKTYGNGFMDEYIINPDVPAYTMLTVITENRTQYLVHAGVKQIR